MRSTMIKLGIRTDDVPAAFAAIADFARFPALADDVRSVAVGNRGSEWAVNFRRGVLRWHETDTVSAADLRISFVQTTGDFADFHGSWQLTPVIGGAHVRFEVTWDFGVDSMAGLMDPIAERVIKRVVCAVLAGLFGDVAVLAGGEALADLGNAA
ncbi:MAG: SRPBCC family protein [Pseudonocardiaceae bacterium]|nr:SRPBCC family protein [Pseudonocardiaceae bacterium]